MRKYCTGLHTPEKKTKKTHVDADKKKRKRKKLLMHSKTLHLGAARESLKDFLGVCFLAICSFCAVALIRKAR